MQVPQQLNQKKSDNAQQLDAIHALMHEGKYLEAIEALSPIVKAMDKTHPTDQEIFALLMVADAQRFSGLVSDAYKNYVVASELDPTQLKKIEPHIIKCLPDLTKPLDAPVFEKHLIEYFSDRSFSNRAVDSLAVKLLIKRYDLTNDDAEVDFNQVISDQFFLSAIKHLVLASPYTESFIRSLRREIFLLAVENGIPSALSPITIAMAEHSELTEYVIPVSEDEKVLLLGIQTLLDTHLIQGGDIQELLEPLLLYLMYEPITNLKIYEDLSSDGIHQWPEPVQSLFENVWINPKKEARLATTIQTLAPINSDVSLRVMDQYMENPYPRWKDCLLYTSPSPRDS